MSTNLILALLLIGITAAILLLIISRSSQMLLILAITVSVITLNVHLEFTFYLYRILAVLWAITLLSRPFKTNLKFLGLFLGLLVVQVISLLGAPELAEGIRQIFIYVFLMLLFLMVFDLGRKTSLISNAIRLYLGFSIVQSIVGIYQVVGATRGWPMYQDLLSFLPVANFKHGLGTQWSVSVGAPRAFGFLTEPNVYAGYLVGVILIVAALAVRYRRPLLPKVALISASLALILSFSRSGWITLIAIGLPCLSFLLIYQRRRYIMRSMLRLSVQLGLLAAALVIVTIVFGGTVALNSEGAELGQLLVGRLNQLASFGASEQVHLLTRLIGIDALVSNPFVGIGVGQARFWTSETYGRLWGGSHSHHLDILGQTGFLGAAFEWAFMILVVVYMWKGWKASNPDGEERVLLTGLLAATIAILGGNLLYFYYLSGYVWFLMGCGVALSRNVLRDNRESKYSNVAARTKMRDPYFTVLPTADMRIVGAADERSE